MRLWQKFGLKEDVIMPKQVECRGKLIDDIITLRFLKE